MDSDLWGVRGVTEAVGSPLPATRAWQYLPPVVRLCCPRGQGQPGTTAPGHRPACSAALLRKVCPGVLFISCNPKGIHRSASHLCGGVHQPGMADVGTAGTRREHTEGLSDHRCDHVPEEPQVCEPALGLDRRNSARDLADFFCFSVKFHL